LADQTILTNFYNSLTSKGTLSWSVLNDLCGQYGVACDTSNPKRITQLYFFSSSFFFFIWIDNFWHYSNNNWKKNKIPQFKKSFRDNSNWVWRFNKATISVRSFLSISFFFFQSWSKNNRNLYTNKFFGTIPTQLGNLTNLQYL